MIEIDGSFGEGGGQVLRTALSLSCHLKKPFRIFKIRANRKKPGLMPQHITCVRAAQLISGAEVKGDSIGSSELTFTPDKVQAGYYNFDIETAGSTSLVLQTLLLPLCFTDSESHITIKGGTHVPWSPPFHYLKDVFLPFLKKSGLERISNIDVHLDIERWGFYPKGGGLIKATINAVRKPAQGFISNEVNIEKRGELKAVKGLSAVGNLPLSIAERQKKSALEILKSHTLNADIEILSAPCIGQGTFFFLLSEFHLQAPPSRCPEGPPRRWTGDFVDGQGIFAGFSSLGQRGKKAEEVGKEATEELIRFLQSDAPVEKRLADQIVPYLALSNEKSSFITAEVTKHLLTNIEIVKKFLNVKVEVSGEEGEKGKVAITP
jgi:RNA 3'-terminal phosphate cyclase (ATP)